MFILMSTFFIYPSNFALETAKDGFLSQQGIATVMALMDVVAFLGGLCFIGLKKNLKENTHFVAPVLFFTGYVLMFISGGAAMTVIGSFFVGFANGAGVPCIIAAASQKAGKTAVSTVMPLLSAALYMGQFLSPFIMSLVSAVFGGTITTHLPFAFAAVLAVILAAIGFCLRKTEK